MSVEEPQVCVMECMLKTGLSSLLRASVPQGLLLRVFLFSNQVSTHTAVSYTTTTSMDTFTKHTRQLHLALNSYPDSHMAHTFSISHPEQHTLKSSAVGWQAKQRLIVCIFSFSSTRHSCWHHTAHKTL